MSNSAPSLIGKPLVRIDGRAKVTGAACYAGEKLPPSAVHAVAIGSSIAKGWVRMIDASQAERAPGVLAVITHENAPMLARPKLHPAGQTLPVLQGPQIEYYGQFIAVAVAESLEQAQYAASLVRVDYDPHVPELFATDRDGAISPPSGKTVRNTKATSERGDAQRGMTEAAVSVDETYTTPIQHHCSMEPHTTLAWWEGERLMAHDATENYPGTQEVLAEVFGLPREHIRIFSDFVGGSFGGKGQSWPQVTLAAIAARQVGRLVKLALTRPQTFTNAGHRTPTVQRFAAATAIDGQLTAMRHDSITHTSQFDDFVEPCGQHTELLYACPNVSVSHRIVRANVGTPTFTRGPGETPGSFAMESAMDELAFALKMDPVALRIRCDTMLDEHEGHPWSSRRLKECYALGAEKFGWSKRSPAPRSMREGHWLIGYGMSATTLGSPFRKAEAVGFYRRDGRLVVECATHEIGVGNYTVLAQIAAQTFGVAVEQVTILLGDSPFPPTPRGGSCGATSVGSAVFDVAYELRRQLIELAVGDPASPTHGLKIEAVNLANGRLSEQDNPARGETGVAILKRQGREQLVAKVAARPGPERGGGNSQPYAQEKPDANVFSFHSFGAHFCEIRVDADLGVARVARWVGVFDTGRVLNHRTARSQALGGIVWGIGNALMEETIQDIPSGAFLNGNLAEYHVAVSADIPELEVHFLDEADPHVTPLGVKSLGELGNVGAAAAIANAIFHATGRRVRDLPITPEKLFV